MDNPKFSAFNITTATYKIVNPDAQEILLHVLIPKGVHSGVRPVLIHFHGGFLMTGSALFPDWATSWSLSHTVLHSAIRISANYRLLPESTGTEILSDAHDVLKWVEHDLHPHLRRIGSDITPDLTKVAIYGESAGGYLAIQSALSRPDLVKSVVAAYPITYFDSPWYMEASETKSPFGRPQLGQDGLNAHLKQMKKGKIVTSAFPPERLELAMATLQGGRFGEFLGTEEELFPARIVENIVLKEGQRMPYLLLIHGKQDSAVPCGESERFVELWGDKFGKEGVKGIFEDGEHGFDGEATLETNWLREGLIGFTKTWLE